MPVWLIALLPGLIRTFTQPKQENNKWYVALAWAVVNIASQQFGWQIPFTENELTSLLTALGPVLVWAVPNIKR